MPITRRLLLKAAGALGASSLLATDTGIAGGLQSPQAPAAPADGAIAPLTSTSGVFIPPRGRAFMKFSFDFPEPSVAFAGHQFGARVFTHENVYTVDGDRLEVRSIPDGVELAADGLVWAGGQQRAAGSLTLRVLRRGSALDCSADAVLDRPVKAIAIVVRGIPHGRISTGAAFVDHKDDEVLFGYPFAGGDLMGPQGNASLTTPLVMIQPEAGGIVSLSSLDDRVRTKRFYFQPGADGYRVELVAEAEAWKPQPSFSGPAWRIETAATIADAARAHYERLARAYGIPDWQTRADVPDWLRKTTLVVTLHGMHFTGYVFNDYARMLAILKWIATRIPADRVLAFISAWDGRYYWDYPVYTAAERMGGEAGFRALVKGGQALGFRMMPMFGANAASRDQPVFARVADAATAKIDGDRMDINWVDWDNDRHQDGWLTYMNLGVDSWRAHLTERIADAIERYGIDAYFLDIAGGWINNPRADMHEGMRRLVGDLRRRYPHVLACGEMHYDALLAFIPLYHSFGQTLVADLVERHARFFQHLSHPAPGRGSTGVHEFGFTEWDPKTLSLSDLAIPTLNVVDDTFDRYRDDMDRVIQRARARAEI
ncbi:MAG: hypothetical protein ACM3SQ_02880 [Betaproteobacteria bacterium]